MPSIRIGLSTDFNLTNELVGINTAVPTVRLDVRGQILSENTAGGTGVSTLTTYDGFLDAQQRVTSNISIAQTTKGNLNSLSGEIILDSEITVTDGTPLTGGRLDSLTVTGAFDLPHGGTASRETTPEKGSTRFNSDLGQLEFYTGTEWRTTLSYDGSGRGRGIIAGGTTTVPAASTIISTINYINIISTGNSLDFGNLTSNGSQPSSASSSTRGIFAGRVGVAPTFTASNVIDYITIASSGNAQDFGDLPTATRAMSQGVSSSTRGIFAGGVSPGNTNVINYVTISTIGNALDFGDLISASYGVSGTSSPTRGVFTGGYAQLTISQFITIASTGNTVKFGDLIQYRNDGGTIGNSIRGIFGGVDVSQNTQLDYITIATTGNSVYFGDMTVARCFRGCSNSTRGVLTGGASPSGASNIIDYITITSTGNAQDFGDLYTPLQQQGVLSDSHGGLGGF